MNARMKSFSHAHNRNNELQTADTTTYGYDNNGNTTSKAEAGQTTTYTYNATDRLTSVQLPDGRTATYTYDPFGRRIKKQVGQETTVFIYADEGLIGEYSETGAMRKSYGWRPNGIWGTNPVFQIDSGSYYFYHNDHLGTPQTMTDMNGDIVWEATYEAFGKATVDPASVITNNLRFPGQYWDEETGLHYNWHRYYDPGTGRYISKDPIGFLGGDKNIFRYVLSNPLKYADPYGLAGPGVSIQGGAKECTTGACHYNPNQHNTESLDRPHILDGNFKYYGNYGGPGWTGGDWRSWEDIPASEIIPSPIDSQDWAYYRHDQCYGKCRTTSCKANMWECFNGCDSALVNDLMKLSANPRKWEEPPPSPLHSLVKRNAAVPTFVGRQIVRGVSDAIPKVYKGITSLFKR